MANRTWGRKQEAFQKAIKEIRQKAGFTQLELSNRLSRPQSFVSKYENGERKLDFVETVEICDACSISLTNFNRAYKKYL